MNKVFTGCGVVGGLALLAVGVVLGLLVPDVSEARVRLDSARAELAALDAAHPYDATRFDAERFAASLAARADVAPRLDAWSATLKDETVEQSSGSWNGVRKGIDAAPRLYEELAAACSRQGVGAREFSAHGRLLWAALAALAVSPAPGLDDLRTRQPALREQLVAMRQRDSSVPLFVELVRAPLRGKDDERDSESREPDADLVAAALTWIGEQPDATRAALLSPAAEVVALRLELLLPEPAS